MKLTKREQEKTMSASLNYDKASAFAHCKHCLKKFLASPEYSKKSPREAMNYELSTYPFRYSNGIVGNIVVVWCKKCRRKVWDSRHLTNLF